MSQKEILRVAIDARINPGRSGGAAQAIMSLIHGLGKLGESEAYTIIVESEQQVEWLKHLVGPYQKFVTAERRPERANRNPLKQPLKTLAKYVRNHIGANSSQWPEVPVSNNFYENLGCDVIHMPHSGFSLCALPTVYNLHDLQHLHYPQFFTPSVIAKRETIYRAGCHFARTVIVGSQWVKDDVLTQYRISPDKIQIIPEHPPTEMFSEVSPECMSEVKDRYQLQQPFAVYPAVTWPHKNHIRLFEALAHLRDEQGLTIRLVCSGSRYDPHWPRIQECLDSLKLQDQVKFVGFVSEPDLKAIYKLSQFLIMPTLFEASSLPIFEAWLEGTPVACSDVTALPDQVMGAALLFDPDNTMSIADAIARIATDDELRERLRQRADRRLQDFDSERTARAYRAVYRRAARFPLTEEDRWLLSWDWMRNPERKMEVGCNDTTVYSGSSPYACGE